MMMIFSSYLSRKSITFLCFTIVFWYFLRRGFLFLLRSFEGKSTITKKIAEFPFIFFRKHLQSGMSIKNICSPEKFLSSMVLISAVICFLCNWNTDVYVESFVLIGWFSWVCEPWRWCSRDLISLVFNWFEREE